MIKSFWFNTNQSIRSSLINTVLSSSYCSHTHSSLQQLPRFMSISHKKERLIQGTSTSWLPIILPSLLHFQGRFSPGSSGCHMQPCLCCEQSILDTRRLGLFSPNSSVLGCMTSSVSCQDIAKPALSLAYLMLT